LELKGFLKMPPQLKCDGVYAAKSGPTFAEIAKNKIRPAVIVEPQDHALGFVEYKNVVAENINHGNLICKFPQSKMLKMVVS
jgi:hypothetical protein